MLLSQKQQRLFVEARTIVDDIDPQLMLALRRSDLDQARLFHRLNRIIQRIFYDRLDDELLGQIAM
ncbi:hypothetical protein D3C80_1872620 [compost metagenome]